MTTFKEPFPILYVEDVERAVEFYCSTFGFTASFRWPPEGALEYAFLRLEPLGIGIARKQEHNLGRDFELCIYTDDTDAAAERLRAAGAEEIEPPTDMPWRERLTYFRDADGHLLHVTQPL